MSRPNPFARDLLQLHRESARGYDCPACGETYHQEPKIWNHAQRDHQDYLDRLKLVEMGDGIRRRFRQEAIDKAQQKVTSTSKAASASADSALQMRSSPGRARAAEVYVSSEDRKHVPAAKQTLGSGQGQGPEKKIDDIGRLSLDQARSVERKERPISSNNPRKRGPEGESESPDLLVEGYTREPLSTRPRHGKISSGGRDVESTRQGAQPDDSDYRRGTLGAKQPLWDPNTDPTSMAKGVRREKQAGHPSAIRRIRPSDDLSFNNQGGTDQKQSPAETGYGRPWIQQPPKGPSDRAKKQLAPSPVQDLEEQRSESVSGDDFPDDNHAVSDVEPEMLLQPETRPISHEQLVVEVKGIYAGLVMVEAKCIDIDERQSAAAQEKDPAKRIDLKNDQWQSLIALHKQLLHEHHDFFLASQHPSASPALSRLAAKYSMPARMWRHGIHAFLEVLRHRLPESLEHMLAFIYIAYSMMALLYETVPAFEDTWIECLGDLGRYRMAIEDDEPRDREVWSNVAKFWYNKASDNTPYIGRLYHHLAILARPYTLEQLSLYTRSLTCVIPFESAKGSIMTLFNPILHNKDSNQRRPSSLEMVFIRIHAILFTSKPSDSSEHFNAYIDQLEKDSLFEKYVIKTAARFKETGTYAAIANIAAIFGYGSARFGASKSRLRLAYEDAQAIKGEAAKSALVNSNDPVNLPPSVGPPQLEVEDSMDVNSKDSPIFISQSCRLSSITLGICLRRPSDSNVYPLVHVYLGFLWSLIIVQQACKYFEQEIIMKNIEKDIPWIGVCLFLNTLALDPQATTSKIRHEEFPRPFEEAGRPLPEDYVLRGQLFTQWLFPVNWFAAAMLDDDERSHDLPSMAQPRKERMLWLGHRIASANLWIRFDKETDRFSTTNYGKQAAIETQVPDSVSHDQDTVMSEVETIEGTPRSMSLAPSESPEISRQSTRASTPTGPHDVDMSVQSGFPREVS